MKVNTVLGPIDGNEMGITLMHEHIVNIEWNFARAFPEFYDRERVVEMFCEEMETLKPYGVRTFVDPTPITLGRDVELLRRCSERSGIHIIACTGIYWQEAPFFHRGVEADLLAELMIREIEHGMEGSDSKPGFIKCASQLDPGETENNQNMLRAAAMASKATGLPIYTHTQPTSQMGRYQKRIFDEEGVAPEKVAYGHAFSGGDGAYVRELMRDGSFAACDQLAFAGSGAYASMEDLADLLAALFKSELRQQIFLSCDAALRSDFSLTLSRKLRDRDKNALVLRNLRRDRLFETLLPALRERGIGEEVLQDVLIGNPRRYFCGGN